MTGTKIVKTSKLLRNTTSTVGQHLDAVTRAREIYLQQIKRAEADYFDRIKHATDVLTGAEQAIPVVDSASPPAEQAPAN